MYSIDHDEVALTKLIVKAVDGSISKTDSSPNDKPEIKITFV